MPWETDKIMRIMVMMQDSTEVGLYISPAPDDPKGHLTPAGPLPACIITMEEGSIWAVVTETGQRILLVPRKETPQV